MAGSGKVDTFIALAKVCLYLEQEIVESLWRDGARLRCKVLRILTVAIKL